MQIRFFLFCCEISVSSSVYMIKYSKYGLYRKNLKAEFWGMRFIKRKEKMMSYSRDRPLKLLKNGIMENKTLEEKIMSKKIKSVISIALVFITIFSTLAITASAASYQTGQYQVASSNGVNVRPSPNSSSRYGAASKGTSFKVTKVSNNWGYTNSIYCANGKTVSGWVCLDYCNYKGSGHSHNYNGGKYYQNAHPHEISVRCTSYDSCGGWKWTGENYKVKDCPQCYPSETTYYTLSYNGNGGVGVPASQRVKANTGFYLSSTKPTRSGYTFLGWSTSKNATSASYSAGAGVRISSNITLYAVWKKNAAVNPTSVSLNYTSCTMNVGNTKQLTATVYPTNATNKSVSWSSSDSQVVSVSSSGKLTAKGPGVATITAKTSNGKTKTCKVTVRGIDITGDILFNYPTVGDVYYLGAKAYPSDTTKFTWSTSNSKIVSISSSGKMTAKATGTATITVKTADGRSESVKITVGSANKWRTGNFDSGYTAKGYTTVTLNKNAGDGKIKIYTYDAMGYKTSGQIHVTLRDWKGNWICEFDCKSGDTLNLGANYGEYRVYVAKKKYPDTIKGNSDDFINVGKCQSWAIECTKNCYI